MKCCFKIIKLYKEMYQHLSVNSKMRHEIYNYFTFYKIANEYKLLIKINHPFITSGVSVSM
ncbi:hypothetical protein Avbf_17110 [Armadillidium vulgare]|nr:hypothetical protein Avbf_17110 [Armadillidium vulgare]